MNYVNDTNYVH